MSSANPIDSLVKVVYDAVKGLSGKKELTLKDTPLGCTLSSPGAGNKLTLEKP